jgi:uncharacterized protein (TIGR03790 family)
MIIRSCLLVLALGSTASALEPEQVLVLVNRRLPASRAVAEHFCRRRAVPVENIVELVLPLGEEISREEYNRFLAGPARDAVRARKGTVRCLVTVHGVPLRVGPSTPNAAEKAELEEIAPKLAEAAKDSPAWRALEGRRMIAAHQESQAAVDSELMLLLWPNYPTARWIPNPLYWQFSPAKKAAAAPTLLVARLDGPTAEAAQKLVDDAIAAEVYGLAGKALIDARGLKFTPGQPGDLGYGYAGYDESFREAAAVLKPAIEVVLDDDPEIVAADREKDIALYMGWYALMSYRRPGNFSRGAIAWHLASGEAVTLRDPKSKAWCPNLLRDGAAVTIGPVAEPYTIAFPKPAEFAGFLIAGKDPLVEVYAKTLHTCSWMTVLVGDPFYTPFRKIPKPWTPAASPRGGTVIFK